MDKKSIRKNLIKAGVKKLKEMGHKRVNAKNILTDPVFSDFFMMTLKENHGHDFDVNEVVYLLKKEIDG